MGLPQRPKELVDVTSCWAFSTVHQDSMPTTCLASGPGGDILQRPRWESSQTEVMLQVDGRAGSAPRGLWANVGQSQGQRS